MGHRACAALVAVIGLIWPGSADADVSGEPRSSHRVRATDGRLAAVIDAGMRQSETFRLLVEQIDGTDGLVYISFGQCGQGVRACLKHVLMVAGPYRLLYVSVDARTSERDLIAYLGHELTHAAEVLQVPEVRTSAAVFFLFTRIGVRRGGRFETAAAVAAGDRVRQELGRPKPKPAPLPVQPE